MADACIYIFSAASADSKLDGLVLGRDWQAAMGCIRVAANIGRAFKISNGRACMVLINFIYTCLRSAICAVHIFIE